MNKYPVSNPRKRTAEVIYYLKLAATALLFDAIVLLGILL